MEEKQTKNNSNNDTVILVAGGTGSRMGSDIPKQFIEIGGKTILSRTIHTFHQYNPALEIIVVMHPLWVNYWQDNHFSSVPKHTVVAGGSERFHSVKNGLLAAKNNGIVAIHDAVRPFVSNETIARTFQKAREFGCAIPTLPIFDSIRKLENDNSQAVDRNAYVAVQTPQCFQYQTLLQAYNQRYQTTFTDDASVCEQAGHHIHLVEGNRENIKITSPFDLKLAETLIDC